jgi:DNA-binding Lrp family transcriptional regulator
MLEIVLLSASKEQLMINIDKVDEEVLRILMEDASIGYDAIAKRIGTSVGTVYNRIKRMKEEAIIMRIAPEIDAVKLGFDICVLIDIRIEGGHLEKVQQKFSKHKNICSIYDITGEYDTTFVAKFKNTEELNKFVKEVAGNEHVMRTSTKLVLNVIKESTAPMI